MLLNKKINLEILNPIVEVFNRLNCLRRWDTVISDDRYNELSKQALNCIITYILAVYIEAQGQTIIWERFPKIALYRAFQKVYVTYDIPEHIFDEICLIGNIHKDVFTKVTQEFIEELTNKEFCDFLCEGIGTFEMDIYRAATKIATLVELMEIAPSIKNVEEYSDKLEEIRQSLERFKNMPGITEFSDIHGKYFKIFSKISSLRNQNRWAVQPYLINCSVSGHLFSSAGFSYFNALYYYNGNEKLATEMFFKDVFHDVPESLTKDFPSPIKNRVPGFREALSIYEEKVLEKYFYNGLPESIEDEFRKVMNEGKKTSTTYNLHKGADYLSADLECYLQYLAGSRHPYFLEAIEGFEKQLLAGDYILSPPLRELHNYFLRYSRNVVKQFEI